MGGSGYAPPMDAVVRLLELFDPMNEGDVVAFAAAARVVESDLSSAPHVFRAFAERAAARMTAVSKWTDALRFASALAVIGVPKLPPSVLRAITTPDTPIPAVNSLLHLVDLSQRGDAFVRPVVLGSASIEKVIQSAQRANLSPDLRVIFVNKASPADSITVSSESGLGGSSAGSPTVMGTSAIINAVYKRQLSSLWHVSLQLFATTTNCTPKQRRVLFNRTLQHASFGCTEPKVVARLLALSMGEDSTARVRLGTSRSPPPYQHLGTQQLLPATGAHSLQCETRHTTTTAKTKTATTTTMGNDLGHPSTISVICAASRLQGENEWRQALAALAHHEAHGPRLRRRDVELVAWCRNTVLLRSETFCDVAQVSLAALESKRGDRKRLASALLPRSIRRWVSELPPDDRGFDWMRS